MKKVLVLVILLSLVTIASTILMFKEKQKLNSINSEINEYVIQKEDLKKKIDNFEVEKKQVEKEVEENVDKDKLRMYEIWKSQNQYLDESL